MLTMKSKYQLLLEKHFDVGLDAEESVDLVQHLIDLDLTDQYPGFDTLAYYYIAEGLCYQVGYVTD
jgi:hypothetical protein